VRVTAGVVLVIVGVGFIELVGEGEIVDTEVCVGTNVEAGVGENVGVAGF